MKIPARAAVFAVTCAAFCAAVFLALRVPAAGAAASDASLYNLEGNVSLTRRDKSAPAELDSPIFKGDVLKSAGAESEFDVTVGGYAGVRVFADGELEMGSVQKISLVFKLKKGTLLFSCKKLPSGMTIEIETPTTIGKIRNNGTQLGLAVIPGAKPGESTARFIMRKGTMEVFLKDANAAVNVLEGRTFEFKPEDYIPNSRVATDEELETTRKANQIPIIEKTGDDS